METDKSSLSLAPAILLNVDSTWVEGTATPPNSSLPAQQQRGGFRLTLVRCFPAHPGGAAPLQHTSLIPCSSSSTTVKQAGAAQPVGKGKRQKTRLRVNVRKGKAPSGEQPRSDLFSWCSGRSGCAPGRSGRGWQAVAGPGRCWIPRSHTGTGSPGWRRQKGPWSRH